MPSRSSPVCLWMLAASLAVAAGLHLAAGSQHGLTGLHGTFFVAAGALQALAAALVARRPSRLLLALAAGGSAALVVTWLVVRTPGLAGGDALGSVAVATAVAELVSLAAAARLLRRPVPAGGLRPLAALGVVALVAVGAAGFADDGDHRHHHDAPASVVTDATQPASHHDDEDAAPHDH